MEARTRWTDDRLDDLHKLVLQLDRETDQQGRTIVEHDSRLHDHADDLARIAATGDRRVDSDAEDERQRKQRRFLMGLAFLTAILTIASNLVALTVHVHP